MKHSVSLSVSSTRRRKGWVSACSWVLKLDSYPPTNCQAVLELELLWPWRRPAGLKQQDFAELYWSGTMMRELTWKWPCVSCGQHQKWDKRVWYRSPVLSATVAVLLKACQLQWNLFYSIKSYLGIVSLSVILSPVHCSFYILSFCFYCDLLCVFSALM